MLIEELVEYGIPKEYVEKFKEEKITKLYPPQVELVKRNLFKDRNLVLSIPTAGGKTFLATLAIINKLTGSKTKIVYIVPLVALAFEKYNYYKKLFDKKYRVAISVGDLDSADKWLSDYDIIIATSEKLDSLIRHNSPWLRQIGLIVVDEIHLINDVSRGPTLEILITRLREITPRAQILALSATIKNSHELAKWLNANILLSDFRPVKLYEGVAYNSMVQFYDKVSYELSNLAQEAAILENTLNLKKQVLFFVSTRKSAEILAENLCKIAKQNLGRNEEFYLEKLSSEIENILEIPTRQCKKLAKCIQNGVAFHHAGLLSKQKRLIEENFRSGFIKVIVATPTLALGVNLPAFRVVVRDAKRYYPGIGASYIPVLEYKQFIGRAGRPQYDEFGEAILVARSEEDAQDLTDRFIMGEPERITSKLAVEPILRMHTLALVASDFCRSEKSLLEFFSKTFYAFQYGDLALVEEKIIEILELLEEWKFITNRNGKISATTLGKRVSELYIDPLTAHEFIESLKAAKKRKVEPFSFLQTTCKAIESRPLLSVRSTEFQDINDLLAKRENLLLQKIPEEYDLEYEEFLKSFKTALMFDYWLNEASEDEILVKYKVAPGELRSRLEVIDWLIYSLGELALLLGYKEILKEIRKTRIRLRYGIKEELIPLVKLEQVGRVRARKLFSSNIKTIESLRKISLDNLSKIVGPKVALIIKNQLTGKVSKESAHKQSQLSNF